MSDPFRTIQDYELFVYSLAERFPTIRQSTLPLARRGATLARVAAVEGAGLWPDRLVTDRLGSYGAAHREMMPTVPHDTRRWAIDRAEVSHEAVRFRERQIRRFKSAGHASASSRSTSSLGICFE